MSAVEETTSARLARKARRGLHLATSPGLWGEQVAYLRHGPAPDDPNQLLDEPMRFPASPWRPYTAAELAAPALCNICRWTGDAFEGIEHCEFQTCPGCGSVGRDRFLHWCFTTRTPKQRWLRLLETSPRMGTPYRDAMDAWFTYRASDFDERAHRAMIRLDLQQIDLPDDALDIVLSAHVLEHVPEPDRAFAELYRVLAPGGRLYLQVPLLQGVTAAPIEPEFHGDDTPVFWRFGWDLTQRLRSHGFATRALVTGGLASAVDQEWTDWPSDTSAEWDVPDILANVVRADLDVVCSQDRAERLGCQQGYMFVTWECLKPAGAALDTARIVGARTLDRVQTRVARRNGDAAS
jgi:SAM-dependent methyltransferase